MTARKKKRRRKMPKPMFKPYNIVLDGDEGATINLYGEVVATHPTDWWTGEPIPGNFIAVDEFLNDLEQLNGKDHVTVHINSVGGDMYGGIAIYNRLKGLAAKVTTINDGLAASAGSIIFMAGDDRKVNSGSNLMIHGALGFLYGYYQVPDLKSAIKQLEAHNRAAVNVYAERTGHPADEIKALVDKETWMTGQDAVDRGFATEVIGGEDAEPVIMKLSPDKRGLMVNGMAVAACCLGKIPDTIPQMSAEEWAELSTPKNGGEPPQNSANPAPQDSNNTHKNGGMNEMEIKNIEDLRKAHPDLVNQIENAAHAAGVAEGAKGERERIQSIEGIQNVVGDAEMVKNAKYGENPIDAKELVYNAAMANAMAGGKILAGLVADAEKSGAADVTAVPAVAPAAEVAPDSPEAMAAQAKADVAAFMKMKEVR